MGDEEYEACWRECVGAPCPVCGARAREGDLQIIVLDKDVNAIKNGSFPWGKTSRPTGGFAGFGGTGTAPETERGGFASALRKEMYGQSERSRKQEYRALSEAFTKLSGFQFGFEAYEKGDLDRAVLWLQRAAQVLDDPTHAAGACMYLGLTWVKKGEPHKAEKAFRDAVDRTDADPTIRSGSADQLGSVLKQLGDIAGARKAFQLAVDLGVPHFASKAAVNLGTLEDEAGNHDKARSLWEFAYESPDDTGGFAAHNLGWYWEQAGDVKKARRFYKIAAKSSTPQVATRAAERLRVLPASSRRLFRRDR
ncbi:Flp pilus assembly protein TadD [Saccharothrix tamanrassetensis]|uniref:Flp pilus assembly protein TadD n=1 Tax=Saccharothrix tamanrassetensis TaxID=1051531 RepID=A0A841CE72_9PSEU|nr:tetratricopeptide repeat protein [Saccharothrix tamanrassetensis]MBB5956842.1 Flp pilus assembly protein TadD [Saccharothrix tamanrassetensis]